MANRHLSRTVVLQTLFEWDSGNFSASHESLMRILRVNGEELGTREQDMGFMQNLLELVIAKRPELDEIIEKAAPEWPIARVALIDRNILRIGLAELLFANRAEVPAKVAINEAIELAKKFGTDQTPKFVNGVLGAIYEDIGSPGKDEKRQKKVKINFDQMIIEELAGALVYAIHEGEFFLAFVHDIFGHWTLSKTKVAEGESVAQAAERGIKAELSLVVKVEQELGVNEYIANDTKVEGGKKRKRVTYFLALSEFQDIVLGPSGGLDDASWFPLSKVGDLNFYDDTLKVIIPAINILAAKERELRRGQA